MSGWVHKKLCYALLLLLGGAFVLACVSAPFVFNGLIRMGRSAPALQALRNLQFEEVISRLVLIYLIVGFYPVMRRAGMTSWAVFGLTPHPDWRGACARGWCLGVASVLLLVIWAWGIGAYVWDPDPWGKVAGRVGAYLVGALLIGWIEEVFFRGGFFGMLRQRIHWVYAALIVSLFFSFVHFLRPLSPLGIAHGHWHSGFGLIPHMMYRGGWSYYVPFALTLFVMSMVLCTLYRRQGHVYFIVGLHAGWVVVLQSARFFFERQVDVWPLWFGASGNMARSWAALGLLVLWWWAAMMMPVGKERADA